jgi:hypothetical protein
LLPLTNDRLLLQLPLPLTIDYLLLQLSVTRTKTTA